MSDNKPFTFKRMFWAYIFCMIPFSLLAGILALFNISAVNFNDIPRYGLEGFFIAIALIPFVGLVFSVTNWLALNFGNFLYNKFTLLMKRKSPNL
jgi:hypothetical protein